MDAGQMTEKINLALTAVNASDATDDYKVEAFKITLQSLLGGQVHAGGAKPAGQPQADNTQAEELGADDWRGKIANRLKITTEQVASLFHKESEDSLRLILDTGILPKNQQTATQDIAKLLTTGRVAASFDESSTGADVIRTETEYYGRLDKSNFSRSLHGLKPNFHYDAKEKTLTPRAPGYGDAATVAKKYLGQEK